MTTNESAVIKEVFAGAIPVKQIEIKANFRLSFDDDRMKELTENIRQNGVLVPILVAKAGKDGYRLIAGERRLRAAKVLGLETIPARVIEADERRIEELQLIENLHREDLGPIEEARAFRRLLETGKHTIEGLAKHVDKSLKYVTRSIRLLELPEKALKAIDRGIISPEHGHQILRVPDNKRERLVEFALSPKWGGVLPTIHELKREIESRVERDLSRACFPKDREYAGEKACSQCSFNTGNQAVLFEGAKTGKCTNGACFTKKMNLYLKEFKEQAEKRFPKLKCVGTGSADYGGKVKGAMVLTPEESKSEKVKSLMEKEPDKFGFAVLKPSSFDSKGAPAAVLVCTDKALLETAIRRVKQPQDNHMMPEEMERERHLQAAEAKALFHEGASKLKAVSKKHLVRIVLALNGSEAAFNALGIHESADLGKTLSKLPEKDLLRLAWLCTVSHWEADGLFAELGVNVDRVRKEARKSALAQLEKAYAVAQDTKKETAERKEVQA